MVNLAWKDEESCVNDAVCASIVEAKCIPVILTLMKKHINVAIVQEWGCVAMSNLAYGNDANCVSIAEAGGIAVILEAMMQHANKKKGVVRRLQI
mmetsp:Transcript_38856/g.62938  ORF Transcript_38856/g.62938 Transcript_38856/m.62938 type:complete len:95 (-) Transcript_38856:26-310(-)